jgi:P2-related tail formation protein
MANNTTILADSISEVPHLAAFDLLWAQRLKAIEIDQLLVYVIDTVTPTALPYLADQFDVAGEKGYRLATTDDQRRAIIKRAIELKRYMGTVWAVRQAMISVGFGDAQLIEGVDEGTPSIDWAKFRVLADLGNDLGLPDTQGAAELTELINYYKNVRSLLVDISYQLSITDTLPGLNDDLFIGLESPPLDDSLTWKQRRYDGTHTHNAAITYSDGNDNFDFIIINF